MDKKGTHNVKILAEKITMAGELTGEQIGKKTSGQVNELIVLFSSLEKCVFSPWQCSSKLGIVHLA